MTFFFFYIKFHFESLAWTNLYLHHAISSLMVESYIPSVTFSSLCSKFKALIPMTTSPDSSVLWRDGIVFAHSGDYNFFLPSPLSVLICFTYPSAGCHEGEFPSCHPSLDFFHDICWSQGRLEGMTLSNSPCQWQQSSIVMEMNNAIYL